MERAYGRPIMSAFHALFSVGGVLAALIGAQTLHWGWSPATTLLAVAAAGFVLTFLAAPTLLAPEAALPAIPTTRLTAVPYGRRA